MVTRGPEWPGDWIEPLVVSANDVIMFGVDRRNGTIYTHSVAIDAPEPTVATFVDPGFSGEVFGAVLGRDDVVKFTTIVPPGVPLGMERRNGHFFADTHPIAISLLAIGGGDTGRASSVSDYRWHVFDETLEPQDMGTAASGLAQAILARQEREFRGRSLMFPIVEIIGSTVESDVLAGAPRRRQLMARLGSAVEKARLLGKTLVVGWIKLDLLSGAPKTRMATAREHYGLVGNGMRLEAAEVTRQAAPPRLIVNQSFGTRTDGRSEVILAEGRLDWDFFSIGFIVPTPRYPFDLVEGTPATLTHESLLMVREIEALAVGAVERGKEWFCPSLEEARLAGTTIRARFATMSPLVLRDPGNHGFTLAGKGAPAIVGVTASGSYVAIELAGQPKGPLSLSYAFGQTGDRADGRPANRGSLTDDWSQASVHVPGRTLHRHARSGRVEVR